MACPSPTRPRSASLACLVPLACAADPSEPPGPSPGITGIGGGLATGDDGAHEGGTLGGTDVDDDDDTDEEDDDDDDDDGEIKLDVGAGDGTGAPECIDGQCRDSGCVAVDLLFIIDNSASMQPYQTALAQAFPTFADTIVAALPPGVNIHVGVTSTEMGFSTSGNNTISYLGNEATACEATGDGGAPAESFYQTPDLAPSNTNGAQGRLYQVGGLPYFDLDTDANAATLDDLQTWFSSAAQIGEFGSQVEMSAAAAAWATDPVNAPANDGFLRDAGAVLVLFFIQDEHDQTPVSEAGALLTKIEDAKAACGGFDCVVGGGFVNEDCLGLTPLGDLFSALGPDTITQTLPTAEAVTPATFEGVLQDTLAQVIVEACNEIEPPT